MKKSTKMLFAIFITISITILTIFSSFYMSGFSINDIEKNLIGLSLASDLALKGLIPNNYIIQNDDGTCTNSSENLVECTGPNIFTPSEIEKIHSDNTESFTVESIVEIKDDHGRTTTDVIKSDFGLASFVETNDRINRPIENGRIDYWMHLKFDSPKDNVDVTGTISVKKPNGQVTNFSFDGEGRTSNDGFYVVRIDTPSGTIRNNISDIVPVGKSSMTVTITSLSVNADGLEFALSENSLIYSVEFNRSTSHTIIENDSGEFVKVWAIDNRLTIRATTGTHTFYDVRDACTGGICTKTYPMHGAELINMKVVDSDGSVVASSSSHKSICNQLYNLPFSPCQPRGVSTSGTPLNVMLQRNSQYTISIDNPKAQWEITTPTTLKNYAYFCKIDSVYDERRNIPRIGVYYFEGAGEDYQYLTCNFPPENPIKLKIR